MHSDAKRGSNRTGGKEVTCVRVPPGGKDQCVTSRCYFVRGLFGIAKVSKCCEEAVSAPRSARLCTGCMTECSNEQIGIDCVFVAGKDVVVAAPSTFTICIVALAHACIFV